MCPPFAIVNPDTFTDSHIGRNIVGGNFIRSDCKHLDFNNLMELMFKILP